jgi:glycerophosphoryl diester phosphodiesterase
VGWGFLDADGKRPYAGKAFRIPSLEELLVELPDAPLNVDIKQRDPPMVEPLLHLLRRLRAEERVRLTSFHTSLLRAVRRRGYPGPTGSSRDEVVQLILAPLPLLRRLPRRGSAIQLPPRAAMLDLARRDLIAKLHELGLRVDYWTVNHPEEAARLLALGADGIMSDDPARIAPAFAS